MGFIKGKFYNRCTRIHELLANVLDDKLYSRFLLSIPEEDYETFKQLMDTVPSTYLKHQWKLNLRIITVTQIIQMIQMMRHGAKTQILEMKSTRTILYNNW